MTDKLTANSDAIRGIMGMDTQELIRLANDENASRDDRKAARLILAIDGVPWKEDEK